MVGVVPFLWIVPLSLYLLTFVIVFGHRVSITGSPFGVAFPAAGGHQRLAHAAGDDARSSCPARAAGGDPVRGLHDLPWRAGAPAAGARAPARVLSRHRRRRRARRRPRHHRGTSRSSATTSSIRWCCACDRRPRRPYAPAAPTARTPCARARALPRRALAALYFLGGLGVGVWRSCAEARPRRAGAQLLRRREDRARGRRGQPKQLRASSCSRPASTRARSTRAPGAGWSSVCGYDKTSALGLARRPSRQAPRRRAADAAAHRRVGLGAGMIAALGRDGDTMRYYEINPAVARSRQPALHLPQGRQGQDRHSAGGRAAGSRAAAEGRRGAGIRCSRAQRLSRRLAAHAPDDQGGLRHLLRPPCRERHTRRRFRDRGVRYVRRCIAGWQKRSAARCAGSRRRKAKRCERALSWALYSRDKSFFESARCGEAIAKWPDGGSSELVWTDKRQQPAEHHQLAR